MTAILLMISFVRLARLRGSRPASSASRFALNMIKSVFEHRLQVKDIIKDRLDGIVEQKKKKFYKDLSEILISQI